MDTCQDIPYEKLNSMNNEMAAHGKYRYTKAAYESTPRPEIVAQEFSRLVPLSEGTVQIAVFHEYIPMRKFATVATDATAFRVREPRGNVLVLSTWEDDAEEGLKFARAASKELLSFVIKSESAKEKDNIGYGNYSECSRQNSGTVHFIKS
jgi:hypothetical protein